MNDGSALCKYPSKLQVPLTYDDDNDDPGVIIPLFSQKRSDVAAKRDWEVYNSHVVKLQLHYSQVPLKLACQLSHVDMLIFHYSDHKPSAGRHGLEKKKNPINTH